MPTKKRIIRQDAIVQVFAERLRSVRTSREMTQRDLAEQAHVTLSYISRLEAGAAAPGIDLLERLARALRIGLNDLLPALSSPETIETYRRQVRERFEAVLGISGRETLDWLNAFFATLVESPATKR